MATLKMLLSTSPLLIIFLYSSHTIAAMPSEMWYVLRQEKICIRHTPCMDGDVRQVSALSSERLYLWDSAPLIQVNNYNKE
jgi:hypothetical protein